MLAYLFWHRPGPGVPPAAYEAMLQAFHAALAADPPAGFSCSRTHRLDAAPWLPGEGQAYEDFYVTAGWSGIEALEAGAVSGSRKPAHDAAAAAASAREGAAGVYRHRAGAADGRGSVASWGARSGGAVWQRAMVLGPAPEWVVLGTDPVDGAHGPVLQRAPLAD